MKRFDKGYIFYHLITDFFTTLVIGFMFLDSVFVEDGEGNFLGYNFEALPFLVGGLVSIYAAFILYRCLYYRTSEYQLTDTEIICRRGVIFRKRSLIECSRIHAINKKQNLIHRLFGIAILTVDSGSTNTSSEAEVMIVEKNGVVDSLLQDLHSLRENGTKFNTDTRGSATIDAKNDAASPQVVLSADDSLYTFKSRGKLIYSLVNVVTSLVAIIVLGVLALITLGFLQTFTRLGLFDSLGGMLLSVLTIMLGAMLVATVVAIIFSLIQSFVAYYGFKVVRHGEEIVISYGLFETHTNTFSLDRIKGVKVRQGIVKRLLGFATVSLEVIGYTTDEDNDKVISGVLVPFCRYSDVNEIISRVLPSHTMLPRQTGASSFLPFISWFGLILTLVTLPLAATVTLALWILEMPGEIVAAAPLVLIGIGALIFLLKLVDSLINHKTAGIAIDGDKITLYNGGLEKSTTTVLAKNIVAVENVTTPWRAKRGITTLILHVATNALTNEVKVEIQDASLAARLESMLVL